MGPTAHKALLTHVRYVERDGAGQDGASERFFDRTSDAADGPAFAERCVGDRHHFRLIVNPEDGRELPDLKAYARGFMGQVERDLGTEIDWIGGAHYDTGRPHLHLLLRGRRDDGRDLVLPREYVSHGLRGRAQALATEILGPRLERREPVRDAAEAGFTSLDRRLLAVRHDGRVAMADLPAAQANDLLRRLTHLETRGLIKRERAGLWRVPDDLGATLHSLGEREGRERAALRVVGLSGQSGELYRLQPLDLAPGERVVGGFVGFAPLGPFQDGPQALVLDLTDGRLAHLRTPNSAALLVLDRAEEGAVVEVRALPVRTRPSDRTIAEIAAEHGGVYSAQAHRQARPQDSDAFIERHVRRLEATSRVGAAQALGGGRFRVSQGYEDAARRLDTARHGLSVLHLRVLDPRTLGAQVDARAFTYLDSLLAGSERALPLDEGFGADVLHALPLRAEQLRGQGLVAGDPPVLAPSAAKALGLQEVGDLFERLGAGGKPVFLAEPGQTFSGVYVERTHVGRGPYAVIEGRHSITLAPWRPALEACRGQTLTGVLQDGAVDFRFGQAASRGLDRSAGLGL